jgi:aminopeptidase N
MRNHDLKSAGLALFLLTAATAPAMADTYPRQPGIQIINYAFDIALNDANNEFVVQDTVSVKFLAPGVTAVELDLCKFSAQVRSPQTSSGLPDPCAEPTGGRGGNAAAPTGGRGMTITAVKSGEETLTFRHENDRLHVTFPHPFQSGDTYQFTVSYRGVPATGILVANNKYGDRGFLSNSWPNKSRNYLAVVDHPSMKATVVTTVTAPRQYQVISNGRLMEQTDLPNSLRRTVWKESSPICTCLMSLGVAPFAVDHFGEYHGIPLSSWVYPQESEVSLPAFRAYTQPILEFFIDHIGPYSYEKLAQVEANGIGGGMELASSIFYGYGAGGPGRQLVAHEMAHQWFGDSAAEKDWDDVWLSEGFATYFALLYQEFQDGHDAFLDGVKRSKTQAINYALAHPDSTIVHDNLADFSKVIANNAQIYQGGAQTLQNIRGVVGTDGFWAGIRLYYSRFQNGNATTDDFRRAMEDACKSAGDRCPAAGKDLAWLFHELLNRGGVLQVAGSWRYDGTAKQVEVTLQQIQTTDVYRMPVEIAITAVSPAASAPAALAPATGQGRGGRAATTAAPPLPPQPARRIEVVQFNQRHQVFQFPAENEPLAVTLDPNAWVMMQATFERK